MDLTRSAALSPAESSPARGQDSWSTLAAESLFTRPGPQAQIIIKKRRVLTAGPAAPADGSPAPAMNLPRVVGDAAKAERAPRVFVTRRAAEAASDGAEALATIPAETPAHATTRRRRRSPAQRPGQVVQIVLRPASEPAGGPAPATGTACATEAADAAAEAADGPFDLRLPEPGAHGAVVAALATVSTLVDEAFAASRLRF